MDWFYVPMVKMHALLAWCSVGLFLVRGLAHQFGAAWVMDERLRTLVFSSHVLIVVSGLSLWGAMHYDPRYEPWMTAKFIALGAYFALGHWGIGRGEFRVIGYLLALIALAYVVAVSTTRQVLLGL
jgi:uncharacterized membrane protein SirB2